MRYYSLRTKLFLYSMIFCFTGVVLVGAYSYFTAREALIQRTYQQLISLKEEKEVRIEEFYRERARNLKFLSTPNNVLRIIASLNSQLFETNDIKAIQKDDNSIIDPQLIRYLADAKAYVSLSFGLPNNRIHSFKISSDSKISGYYTSSLVNTSLGNLYQKAIERKGVVFQDLTKGSLLTEYSSFIASPIYNADSILLGVIFLEISDKAINGIMAEQLNEKGLGNTGEVYLVGQDNLLRSSSRFIEKSILLASCNSEVVKSAHEGKVGVQKTIDYRNQKVLSAYGPVNIDDLKWVIIAEMDYEEAMKEIIVLGKRILLISFLVFITLTIGVFILSKKITAPLIRLKEVAISVGDGKYEQTLPITHHDEIGLLTDVFNKMVLQIKHITSSLKEREQRLTHFYKATIDGIVLHKAGTPVLVNHALSYLTGYSEDELIKRSPQDYLLIDVETYISAQQNAIFSFEAILKTRSDRKVPVEVQKNRLLFHGQEVESLVIRDISRRKAIEEELHTERLRQMRSVIDGQEQERQRLSRELHDGLGQTLVAIKLKLESIPLDELGNQRKTIESVKQMFNHTIEETRRMSNNLMPAALTEFSLAVVLRNLCIEIESNSGINVSLVIGVLPESFNQLLKTYIYRIAQEALNNIVKHSGASRAVISIFSDISKLYLHIEDNGVGYNPSKGYESGNGLYNMKERAILLNGKFEIITSVGNGVKIQAEFPIFPKQKM
ncbi:MAG: PAS domain S-box protein [Bacteroidales bacterium]|nr:PAS domain S-box protein [Bacteroidales bacterium]